MIEMFRTRSRVIPFKVKKDMGNIDDLECDIDILRDVVFQISQDVKTLAEELVRVKQLVEDTKRAAERSAKD